MYTEYIKADIQRSDIYTYCVYSTPYGVYYRNTEVSSPRNGEHRGSIPKSQSTDDPKDESTPRPAVVSRYGVDSERSTLGRDVWS